jgi:hypothetical protein
VRGDYRNGTERNGWAGWKLPSGSRAGYRRVGGRSTAPPPHLYIAAEIQRPRANVSLCEGGVCSEKLTLASGAFLASRRELTLAFQADSVV